MLGKHSQERLEIKKLKEILKLKEQEIKDIKVECASVFKIIRNTCMTNEYNGLNDKQAKLRKIYEIADDNYLALVNDLVIDGLYEKGKIIELSNTRKSLDSSIKNI